METHNPVVPHNRVHAGAVPLAAVVYPRAVAVSTS